MSTLGSRLKTSREALALSQGEIEKIIGVKAGVVSNWERDINKPNADKLVLLCKALNIKLSYLLDYSGNELPEEQITLAPDEGHLVRSFRLLTPEGKSYVLQTMRMALTTYSKDGDLPKGENTEDLAIS